jgi:hydroxyacyl-ACP dehydratase HTD2-like protein with hotdog domain
MDGTIQLSRAEYSPGLDSGIDETLTPAELSTGQRVTLGYESDHNKAMQTTGEVTEVSGGEVIVEVDSEFDGSYNLVVTADKRLLYGDSDGHQIGENVVFTPAAYINSDAPKAA